MASVAQIIIEVDDTGAAKAFKNINVEAGKLGPQLQQVQRVSEQTFNNIEKGALKARESAALVGEEFGVKIPRALRGTIAEASGIGPIFTAAFSGLAAIGFAQIIFEAGKRLVEFTDHLGGWSEQAKKTKEQQEELNKIVAEGVVKVGELQEAYRLIGLDGLPRISVQQTIANEKFEEGKRSVGNLTAQLEILKQQAQETQRIVTMTGSTALTSDIPTMAALKAKADIAGVTKELAQAKVNLTELGEAAKNVGKEFSTTFSKDQADEIERIAKATEEASTRLQEMTGAANKAGLTGEAQITADALAQIAAVEKIYSKEPALAAEAAAAVSAIEAEAMRKRATLRETEDERDVRALQEYYNKQEALAHQHAEKQRRMEDETINIERQAAIAMAPPWERANATIVADYQARMDKIKEMQATEDLDSAHAARMAAAAWTDAFGKMRDQLANQMETLFDNITSGNIGKFFLTQLKHMIFQMVAAWILGLQQMKSAANTTMNSGGGILGSIFGSLGLGGIFGGGGGGSQGGISSLPGVITNFGGLLGPGGNGDFGGETSGGGGGILGALGLSAGGGAGAGGVLPAGAGAAAGQGGILNNLFKLFSGQGSISGLGLTALGASLLASNFLGGGILHGLGGAAGGALTGLMIGGPIGALIGGIVGFFSGFFQHSTRKARLAIEANIKAQAKTIEDSYNLFQSDWTSSRTALEQLRQQGVDALKQAGVKDINRSRKGHVDQWIDKAEKEIDATQAERNRRAALTFGAPQFRFGGFVGPNAGGGAIPSWFAGTAMHFAGGGAVPAILHEGEYVMRPEAVSRIGVGTLSNMNSGGGGDTHIHVQINAVDAQSFDDFLGRGDGIGKIVKHLGRGSNEGRW